MEETKLGAILSIQSHQSNPGVRDIPSLSLSWRQLVETAQSRAVEEANSDEDNFRCSLLVLFCIAILA